MPRSNSRHHEFIGHRMQQVLIVVVCGLLLFGPATALGESLIAPEYEVKLGFIYNFINFTTWPDEVLKNNPDTLTMCFASDHPSSSVLYKLDGKSLKGRKIKVSAFNAETCLEKCQIIFFATQDKVFIKQVLELTKGRSILTIGEVDGFTKMGGAINFFKDRNRLRFRINMDATVRNELKLSSQLLGSAQIVREGKEGKE
jgi:hypothetical protein